MMAHQPLPTERETLKRGLSLLRRCWLPILLAGVLCSLTAICVSVIEHIGVQTAEAAAAHLHPGPVPESIDDFIAYQVSRSAYAEAVNEAFQPYRYLRFAVSLLNLVIEPVVLLGLNRGLLRCLAGGRCSLRDVFGGLRGGKRAIGVGLLVTLIIFGIDLAGRLIILALEALLPSMWFLTAVLLFCAALATAVVTLWFDYRYLLAPLHCADEANIDLSAADCLRNAHQDQQQYGILGMLFTLWPVWVIGLAYVLLNECCTGYWLVPVSHLLSLAVMMLQTAILAAMYARLRMVPDEQAPDEGRARAIALSRGAE